MDDCFVNKARAVSLYRNSIWAVVVVVDAVPW